MNPTTPLDTEFARLAGDLAEEFSFSRSLGQIYGLLYMQEAPMALEDIGRRLSMSKGNVSINIRLLEAWGAVRPLSVVGSRKDYYEANRDIKGVALRRLSEGLSKRLDHAERRLAALLAAPAESAQRKRVQELETLLARSRRALKLAAQWFK
jgi:DNA-binding transcriptional regulator GbsR (MarR family)